MYINDGVEENLRFLILEVHKQLERTIAYIHSPSPEGLKNVLIRDNYIDNLKTVIQRKCFTSAASQDVKHVDALKAINIVASNLEQIADFCENILRQLTYIEDEDILEQYDFDELFHAVLEGVSLIPEAIFDGNESTAISICRIETKIDDLYAERFQTILNELKSGKKTKSLITTIFIARYLERMGDSLLNIGEAAISVFLGERIKIEQLDALRDTLEAADLNPDISDLSLSTMGETKSGCKIDLVSGNLNDDGATMVIFKEGHRDKLKREKEGVAYWDSMMPGLAPTVYAHHQAEDSAAILFEYLSGNTFEEILLNGSDAELDMALDSLVETMSKVWLKTKRTGESPVDFVGQIRSRLNDIYAVHPEYADTGAILGNIDIPSFENLLDQAGEIENMQAVPFSVLVHGDLNIDNIIFDSKKKRIRFIDLHRSSYGGYVQDISVFMVSNFRLQGLDAPIRKRIGRVVRNFHAHTAELANGFEDKGFEVRLGLGLARSFLTSTRFVLENEPARDMLLRARYLLESITRLTPGQLKKYRVPEEILYD